MGPRGAGAVAIAEEEEGEEGGEEGEEGLPDRLRANEGEDHLWEDRGTDVGMCAFKTMIKRAKVGKMVSLSARTKSVLPPSRPSHPPSHPPSLPPWS